MWYVLQVHGGTERNIALQAEKIIPKDILESAFVPYYEEKRHVQGEWKMIRKVLFPGYVFVITEDICKLHQWLWKLNGFTKLIGIGKEILPLTEKEVWFMQRLGGNEQIVRLSEGIIENDKVYVISGPLRGLEGYIRKIDRHKQKAWLEVDMFNRTQRIQVGLEIVHKV